MARLLGPDMGSRYAYLASGAPAANLTAVVYANSAGTILADILAYQPGNPGVPGGPIANSQVTTDGDGLLPYFWLPDGQDRVWVSVSGGTITPVDADYNARIDKADRSQVGVFNVRDYGAVGDGVADDTTAILAATSAAHTAQLGVIYFPAGKYKLTSSAWSVITRRVSIVGDGPQTTQIWPTGLAAGTYALTLGWENTEVGQKSEPYDAIRGVSFIGPTGVGQANCLRLGGSPSTTFFANSLTIRDVGFYGFDTQVDLANNVYLVGFDRVSFNAPQTYGVRMGQVTNAGENVAFRSCTFANGTAATLVFLDQTSSSFYFAQCSFDYSHRALHQRAGMVFMSQCHFETDTTHGGPGDAFLLVDRNGLVDRPVLSLTDCDFFALWDDYDTCIRLLGSGDQALRIVNPSVKTTATQCPYLVRDDGPVASDIRVEGAWYSSGSFTPPKLRNQGGVEWPITAGQVHTHDGPGAEGAWTDFSASLALQSQTSTDPTFGNSTREARYRRTGKTVDFTFQITIGSTFTAGAGLYRIPLPVAALAALGFGSAYVLDNGTSPQTGALRIYATQYLEIHLDNLTAALGAAGPGTAWATGDVIGGSITYETA